MTSFKLTLSYFIFTLLFNYSCSSKADNEKSGNSLASTNILNKDTSLNGLYKGLEYMGTSNDPVYPGKEFKSYHLGYLKIKCDSIFLDQSLIFVYKNDTSFSASDGGYYYYSGTFKKTGTTIIISLKELFCDYCGVPVKTNPDGTEVIIQRTKRWEGRLTGNGFTIDGYVYARTTKKENLISEHVR